MSLHKIHIIMYYVYTKFAIAFFFLISFIVVYKDELLAFQAEKLLFLEKNIPKFLLFVMLNLKWIFHQRT